MKYNFADEIQRDNQAFLKYGSDCPFYKRVGFANGADFYITKSNIDRYDSYKTGETIIDDNVRLFRIFPWYDIRAKEALIVELGDEINNCGNGEKLGEAQIKGSYVFKNNTIKEYQYESLQYGKYFTLCDDTKPKISIKHFSQLKEIIPMDKGAEAIFANGTFIIDGVAGSGKSTIAIQKIKILENCNQKNLIIVGDSLLLQNFTNLAKSFGVMLNYGLSNLNNIIMLNEYFKQNFVVPEYELQTFEKAANKDFDAIKRYKDNEAIESNKISVSIDEYNRNILLLKILKSIKFEIEKPLNHWINNAINDEHCKNKINEIKELKINNIDSLSKKVFNDLFDKTNSAIKTIKDNIKDKENQDNNKTEKIEKINEKLNEAIEICDKNTKDSFLRIIENLIQKIQPPNYQKFYARYLFDNILNDKDLARKVNKNDLYDKFSFPFDTIIIDEAQNLQPYQIENIRANAWNLILTGDTIQSNNESMRKWSNIINYKRYKTYYLAHNYRQIYELAQVAYNYRQLLQGNECKDIKYDYFDNEMGFEKPKYYLFINNAIIQNIMQEAIKYRIKNFVEHFPIVLICEDKYKKDFEQIKNSLCFSDNDLQIVDINEIQGKEFPIVIVLITKSLNENLLYVAITRAQYRLTMISFENSITNENIAKLIQRNEILLVFD